MRVIEKVVGENVSAEMIQEAKNLRNLATLVEGGTVVAVAYAWVEKDGEGLATQSTFCGDRGHTTLMGAVSMMKHRLAKAIDDAS
jgi:hypothetical protein